MFMVPRCAFAGRGARNRLPEEVSTMTEKVPILVVLGIDVDGRTHASRFEERDAPFVVRAAELMGFHAIHVASDNEELHAVAEQLPLGKIFATGRAFVPFVSRSAFDRLATMVEGGVTMRAPRAIGAMPTEPDVASAADAEIDAGGAVDTLWSEVEIGSTVLATQPSDYDGWWESIVVAVNGDDLTLRWRDGPPERPFHVSRRNVALLHPAAD
jgi:hypothetical protein